MAQPNKPESHLYVGCHDECTHTWALDPPMGRNGFRIVVHCRRAQVRFAWSIRQFRKHLASMFVAPAHGSICNGSRQMNGN
jgi:hypothetical protein